MQNRPTATELLDAVRDLIANEILPTITDDGLRFKALIAANLLAIVGRELSNSDPLIAAELKRLNSLLPDVDLDLTLPASETILTMNRLLADQIRQAPADSDLITVGGPAWNHLKQTLKDQLSIAAPKFDTNR
jgi:Domain of unknown function (DUF6285)